MAGVTETIPTAEGERLWRSMTYASNISLGVYDRQKLQMATVLEDASDDTDAMKAAKQIMRRNILHD